MAHSATAVLAWHTLEPNQAARTRGKQNAVRGCSDRDTYMQLGGWSCGGTERHLDSGRPLSAVNQGKLAKSASLLNREH